jgi:hypothetical protein
MRFRLALSFGVCLAGCDGSSAGAGGSPTGGEEPVSSIFVVPQLVESAGGSFFDQPWPSDLRREADGSVRFAGFPNPRERPILDTYVASMAGVLDGFSPVAAGYLRFTGPLDLASLPATPGDALDETSSLALLDIDPSSPEYGERKLVAWEFRGNAGVYAPANTLAFMPALGYPLRRSTRYAFVVTDSARARDGGSISRAPALDALLSSEEASGALEAARIALSNAVDEIEGAGIARDVIVHLTVFTTNDPLRDASRIRDWVRSSYPTPTVDAASVVSAGPSGSVDVFEGRYGPSPDFQAGSFPFGVYGEGGALSFGTDGVPIVERELTLRFALAVPNATACPEPADGYPIVLYAHGTGGDYRSMLGGAHEAENLGARCIATMGIDQVFHGDRLEQGSPDLLFFNVLNPVAGRANAT